MNLFDRIVAAVPAEELPRFEKSDKTLAQAYLETADKMFWEVEALRQFGATPEFAAKIEKMSAHADEYESRGKSLIALSKLECSKNDPPLPHYQVVSEGPSSVLALFDDVLIPVYVCLETREIRFFFPHDSVSLETVPADVVVAWKRDGNVFRPI